MHSSRFIQKHNQSNWYVTVLVFFLLLATSGPNSTVAERVYHPDPASISEEVWAEHHCAKKIVCALCSSVLPNFYTSGRTDGRTWWSAVLLLQEKRERRVWKKSSDPSVVHQSEKSGPVGPSRRTTAVLWSRVALSSCGWVLCVSVPRGLEGRASVSGSVLFGESVSHHPEGPRLYGPSSIQPSIFRSRIASHTSSRGSRANWLLKYRAEAVANSRRRKGVPLFIDLDAEGTQAARERI